MVYNDLVDGRVVAISRSTGEIMWDEQIARTGIEWDFYGKEQFTAAPLAVEGKIPRRPGLRRCRHPRLAGGAGRGDRRGAVALLRYPGAG